MKRPARSMRWHHARCRGSLGSIESISWAVPVMVTIGFLRSWDTVVSNSFFICSSVLKSVMSRRMAAKPIASPNGVLTGTTTAWAVRPSGQRQLCRRRLPAPEERAEGFSRAIFGKEY